MVSSKKPWEIFTLVYALRTRRHTAAAVQHCTCPSAFAENPSAVLSNPLHAIAEQQDVTAAVNSSDDGRESEDEFQALMKQTMHSDEWQEIKDENYDAFYYFNARLKVR
jgi:hypothetical protein